MASPAVLKTLWEKRQKAAVELKALAELASGREYTAEETQAEERMVKELSELDTKINKGMDEIEREQRASESFKRYEGLMDGGKLNDAAQAQTKQADGLRAFLKGETRSWDTEIDPNVQSAYNLKTKTWEQRDLGEVVAGSITSAVPLPTSFSGQLYEALVASVGVLKAKNNADTLFLTGSGEPLVVPRATAYGGAAWIGESVTITENDPTLSSITLSAFGDKALMDISHELVEDTGFDILGFVARTMGRNAGLLADAAYVNGTGTGQPTGFLAALTVGVTGPVGTTVSLGTQATAGQGSDLLVDLMYSVIDPYRANGAFLLNDNSVGKVARLKGSGGEPVWQPSLAVGMPDTLMGRPMYTDPNIPVMAANARSIVFGDFNGYAVRIVRGLRFERSDHAKFENDLISFKAVLRTDGKLIDANAIKVLVNSAT
jgi:HK97 family phage major capsid protein